jgi:hypothetical protein
MSRLTDEQVAEIAAVTDEQLHDQWSNVLAMSKQSREAFREVQQWRKLDVGTIITALMYGNPPGGWSDPKRIKRFQRAVTAAVADLERLARPSVEGDPTQ